MGEICFDYITIHEELSKGISYYVLTKSTSASLDCGMCFMPSEAEVFMCKYTIPYKNNQI